MTQNVPEEPRTEAATDQSTEISKRDMWSLFWRSFLLQSAFNFERFQNMGWWFGMKPLLNRWYSGEDRKSAYKRHLVFFNTHPWVVGIVFGLVASMESRKAAGEEIDEDSIQGVKVGTMGPLAGIGDSLFFGAARPVLSGLTASLAVAGNLVAPFLFFFGINAIHFASRWYGLKYGLRYGQQFLEQLGGDRLERVRESAVMIGLLVTGALTAEILAVTTPLEYTSGDAQISIQESLDQILPNILPLAATLGVFALVRKRISPTWVLVALTVVGFAGGYFGILA